MGQHNWEPRSLWRLSRFLDTGRLLSICTVESSRAFGRFHEQAAAQQAIAADGQASRAISLDGKSFKRKVYWSAPLMRWLRFKDTIELKNGIILSTNMLL
jgi:hypothetical protein